ncbi:MAG: conjugal transfer protein TraR [Proteobacteria bacterium]|nr:MAG: conjugal transfer protein TraR [Pseudomonadota bacterium]
MTMTKNAQFLGRFRSLFEQEKTKLLASQSSIVEQLAVLPEDMMDEADFTALELDQQMTLRLRARESLYFRKVEEALTRIKDGTFGQCESCEEEIEAKRLEARPTTTLCFSCKTESERREQIHIDGHRSKSLARRYA